MRFTPPRCTVLGLRSVVWLRVSLWWGSWGSSGRIGEGSVGRCVQCPGMSMLRSPFELLIVLAVVGILYPGGRK